MLDYRSGYHRGFVKQHMNIIQLFENQVVLNSQNIAVICGAEQLSYASLNKQANQLANYFLDVCKLACEDIVAVALDKTEQLIVVLFAILKAGGAYVTIDKALPVQRQEFILVDSCAKFLITDHEDLITHEDRFSQLKVINLLEPECVAVIHKQEASNPQLSLTATQLAYIIYTSGTTGTPKGVMIEHGSVVNLAANLFGSNTKDLKQNINSILFLADTSFDVHVWEVFGALLNGLCLHVIDEKTKRDLARLHAYIVANDISAAAIPAALLDDVNILPLKILLAGGEVLNHNVLAAYLAANIVVANAYGPTEATVMSSMHLMTSVMDAVNIGMPLPNAAYHIVDDGLQEVAPGTEGELCISGVGLARGYLHQAELNARNFIEVNGLNKQARSIRVYRTGDLVKQLPTGACVFIRRKDQQLKIRGYTVEPHEIETVLNQYPGIIQSAAVIDETKTNLIIYYCAKAKLCHDRLRAHIAEQLPVYMHPQRYIYLEKMPLSTHDKIDRHALAAHLPSFDKNVENEKMDLLSQLKALWQAELATDAICEADDFYKLGGNSILAARIANKIRQRLNINVDVADILELKSIENLIVKINNNALAVNSSEAIILRDYYSTNHTLRYNEHIMLDIHNDLSGIAFNELIDDLTNCYEILHTNYIVNDGKFSRVINSNKNFVCEYFDYSSDHDYMRRLNDSINQFAKLEFDLLREKLIRFYFFKLPDAQNKLFITFFHALLDGVSLINILLEKLQSLLNITDSKYSKKIQPINKFIKTSDSIKGHYTNGSGGKLRYWRRFFSNDFFSNKRGDLSLCDYAGKQLNFSVDEACKLQLKTIAEDCQVSMFDILLSAFYLMLYAIFKRDDLVVRINVDERILAEGGDNTLGCFINNTFCRVKLDINDDLIALINKVKHTKITAIKNILAYETMLKEFRDPVLHASAIHFNIEPARSSEHAVNYTQSAVHVGEVKTDLYFELDLNAYGICGRVEYRNSCYREKDITLMIDCYQKILYAMPTFSEQLLDDMVGDCAAINPDNQASIKALPKALVTQPVVYSEIDAIEAALIASLAELLNIEQSKLNLSDDFFQLGGDSIICMQWVNRIKQQLQLSITVQDIFQHRTIDKISQLLLKKASVSIENNPAVTSPQAANLKITPIAANSLQIGMLHHALMYPDDDAYHTQLIIKYPASLNCECFYNAWRLAQQKYPVLGLYFNWQDNIQQIFQEHLKIFWKSLSVDRHDNFDERVKDIVNADRKLRYQLDKAPLWRVYYLTQASGSSVCVLSYHHAIMDGWSIQLLLQYVQDTYLQLVNNKSVNVKPDTAYCKAQHYLIEQYQHNLTYWRTYLDKRYSQPDLNGLLSLARRDVKLEAQYQISDDQTIELILQPRTFLHLKNIGRQYGVTFNAVLQFIFQYVLCVYGHSEQSIVGTVLAGRNLPIPEVEQAVGLFINTVPIIYIHHNRQSAIEAIQQLQSDINHAAEHSQVNLAKLNNTKDQLFNIIFVYENYPTFNLEREYNFSLEKSIEKLNYPLVVRVYSNNEQQILFNLTFDNEIFCKQRLQDVLNLIAYVLDQVIKNPLISLYEIQFVKLEKNVALPENLHHTRISSSMTIASKFEAIAHSFRKQAAVKQHDVGYNYANLNSKANQLAHYLWEYHSVHQNDLVALLFERNPDLIVCILAILKCGAAYVPVMPDHPLARIQEIVEDCKPKCVLTQSKYIVKLNELNLNCINIEDQETANKISSCKDVNLNHTFSSSTLAYIIYTSGTTGKPKGVMQTHHNVLRLLEISDPIFNFKPTDVWTMCHAYAFDFSVWEMWGALLHGAKLIMPTLEEVHDCNLLLELCVRENVSILNQTPSAFYPFMDAVLMSDLRRSLNKLRFIVFGGEALSFSKIRPWVDAFGYSTPQLINMYGTTETTVHATYKVISPQDMTQVSLIGQALPDMRLVILDQCQRTLPMGAPGELYIGGEGLAAGYLNQPELSAQKFIHVNALNNLRLYKTGDLVRRVSDAEVEYLGRIDKQVKVHGYRIELGDIEHALLKISGIKQCAVVLRDYGQKNLVAYYIASLAIDRAIFMKNLAAILPNYMIPKFFVKITNFPRTVNGKLDINALPAPNVNHQIARVNPNTTLENKIIDLWALVLGLNASEISLDANFFALGGDSITSIQLVNAVRQHLNKVISVKDIFDHASPRALHNYLLSINEGVAAPIENLSEQGVLSGNFPLLAIQRWFLKKDLVESHYWNQAFLIRTPILDFEKLQTAFKQLLLFHDQLRVLFNLKDESAKQYYYNNCKINITSLSVAQLSARDIQAALSSQQSNFDLQHGPLCTALYLYGYEDGSARIFFSAHHMLIDTVSWRIICEDLKHLYENNFNFTKGTSYRQWGDCLRQYAQHNTEEEKYWRQICGHVKAYNEALEKYRQQSTKARQEICFTADETQLLLKQCNLAYHTRIDDLLIVALSLTLNEIIHADYHCIALEGHGREAIRDGIDLSRTVGWFTSIYPICLSVKPDIASQIKFIKEYLRAIPYRGVGYAALIGYHQQPLPLISFNYLGQFNMHHGNAWYIYNENAGQTTSVHNYNENLIDINAWIIAGQLRLSIDSEFDETLVNRFMASFSRILKEIITHTCSLTRSYLTPSDISVPITEDELDYLQDTTEVGFILEANNLQQGFIYHALQQEKSDEAYRVQLTWEYFGNIEPEKLQQAWQVVQTIYPALRLRFAWDTRLLQIVDAKSPLAFLYSDLSHLQAGLAQDTALNAIKNNHQATPYNFSQSPLFNLHLIKLGDAHYYVIFNKHHIILDGWSIAILINKVHECYVKLLNGEFFSSMHDETYIEAQKYLASYSDLAYWKQYLKDIDNGLSLSALMKHPSTAPDNYAYRTVKHQQSKILTVDNHSYQKLKNCTQVHKITLSVIVQYAWHKILSIYGNSDQTLVGMVVSGRLLHIKNIEQSVGLYINTVPIIVKHNTADTIIDILRKLQDDSNVAHSKSNVNLSQLSTRGDRIFNNLFIFENFPSHIDKYENFTIKFHKSTTKLDYPLNLIATEIDEKLCLELRYDGELFSSKKMAAIQALLVHLIDQIASNVKQSVNNISLVTPQEYNLLVNTYNSTANNNYQNAYCLQQLFEMQVQRTPQAVALCYADRTFTYTELNQLANRLAHCLRDKYHVKAAEVVASCVARSAYTIITLLGILKAGACYVALDDNYPQQRSLQIAREADIKCVLVCDKTYDNLLHLSNNRLRLIKINEINLEEYGAYNPIGISRNSDPAYLVFTSGSTGVPKGIVINHQAIVDRLGYLNAQHPLPSGTICAAKIPTIFDPFIREVFLPLLQGRKLLMLTEIASKDVIELYRACIGYRINFLIFVPSHLLAFIVYLEQQPPADISKLCLRKIFICGESLSCDLVKRILKLFPNIELSNQYGPSECCQFSFEYKINTDNVADTIVPAGKLVTNMQAFVVSGDLQLLPHGAIGELCLSSDFLANGYLNETIKGGFTLNHNKSSSQLLPISNTKFYRTGDMVRWLEDGNLQFIGRLDQQIKLNGYRIELNEIKLALNLYPTIDDVIVQVKGANLCAYYLSIAAIDQHELLAFIALSVPTYMLPQYFVHLSAWPLTVNGKLDYRALPAPKTERLEFSRKARTTTEGVLLNIFSEILQLKIDRLSIDDDFFVLGGNSLSAIRLLNCINQQFEINVSLKDIFKYRTAFRLAELLQSDCVVKGEEIVI